LTTVLRYYERNLPHWHPEGKSIFVTWRLYGLLPRGFVFGSAVQPTKTGLHFIVFDRRLDEARFGPVWLASPEIAETVAAAIRKGQDELEQYTLQAFVVMANHVHLLMEPRIDIARIMKGIKGATARNANRILGRTGKVFWQDESFDHWTRDALEEGQIRTYIERNPVKAGLAGRPEDWPWSSANKK
jgi:putative transposase